MFPAYTTKVTFPVDEWRRLRTELKNTPIAWQKKIDAEINLVLTDALVVLAPYPPKVKTPIRWTSKKQEYYAKKTKNWGKGMPYVRTGLTARSWTAKRTGNQFSSSVTFTNTAPGFIFTMGKFQQGFHADTGWVPAAKKADQVRQKIRRRIVRLMVLTVNEAVRGKR